MKHTRIAAGLLAGSVAFTLAACSPSNGGGDEVTSLTIWDYFTHLDSESHLARLYEACEEETGISIERTADAALADSLLQAASGGSTPDLVILDNPNVAEFAETGLLVSNADSGLDVGEQRENILAAAQSGGEEYGGSIGSNTLALFYNTEMLAAAGVEPPTNWDEFKAAVAATTVGDVYGIAFSAIAGEEASFQFEPFLWGAGGSLEDLSSPEAVEALTLWTDWVTNGQASQSNLSANQQDIRDQFASGNAAMMINGTWQLNALNESGIPYAVVPIPAIDGGPAPSPLGGEFIQIVAGDEARVAASTEFAQCLIEPSNLGEWIAAQSYVSPYPAESDKQAAENEALVPWVDAIAVAEGRTADLGSAYPTVSRALSTAIQEALSGVKSPSEALEAAQASVE
jgi:multiple sugar transport system substrate-binding protein